MLIHKINVRLSGDNEIEVRQLMFLELEEQVVFPDNHPYLHTYMVEGHPQVVGYTLDDYQETPIKPQVPYENTEPDTFDRALWEQYRLYRAVLLHEQSQVKLQENYLEDCAKYILRACVSDKDRDSVVSANDYDSIYRAVLCPEVKEEDILAALASVFQGHMEGNLLMDCIEETARIGRAIYAD